MIKISRECAKSLEHLITNNDFEKQTIEMFELNPHFMELILVIYGRTISSILINDPNITETSLKAIETGIKLLARSMQES